MRRIFWLILIVGFIAGFIVRELLPQTPAAAKLVTIQSRNLQYQVATRAETVEELLAEQGLIEVVIQSPEGAKDLRDSSPASGGAQNDTIAHGMTVEVRKPVNLVLADGGSESAVVSDEATVGDLLLVNQIGLAPTDRVNPAPETYLTEGLRIVIDRIVDLEVVETAEIPYEIILDRDVNLFYGKEEVVVPGRRGQKEQLFLITYTNGVETRRRLLQETIIRRPEAEVKRFGTKIEVEEEQTGRASWYAYRACMCAAHPFYERGRFVRVTSLSSGKSIIVQINDRGPNLSVHPDRIIDLDAVAFRELAPLGAGTIAVEVELLR